MEYFIDGRLDRNGVETDQRAKQYAAEHRVNYAEALRTVVKESNKALQQKLNHGMAKYQQEHGSAPTNGFRTYEDSAGNILQIELDHSGQGITRLGNIVSGLPRNEDHSVNIELALKIIRAEFSDIGREASGGYLHHQAMRILGRSRPDQGMDLMSAMRQAQMDFPQVAGVYNGGQMSEAALRQILFPLFKTEQTPPAPGERSYQQPSVKRYSSGNVYFDENGHEVHKYSFDVCRR